MNLNDIRTGSNVVIDANIFMYALQKSSPQCERLLGRCIDEEVYGIVPLYVLAEVMHRMMIAEARDNNWIAGSNPAKRLSEQPDRVRDLVRSGNKVRDLLAMGLQMEPVIQEDFISAMIVQRETGLMTNDALLIAVCQRLRVDSIASADNKFHNVRGIVLFAPDDIGP
jgi:predicted nucleic acid-binding protein